MEQKDNELNNPELVSEDANMPNSEQTVPTTTDWTPQPEKRGPVRYWMPIEPPKEDA